MGRPMSLSFNRAAHRSNSDPDLPGSAPGSPDQEVASIITGGKPVDRSGSLRQDSSHYMSRGHSRKVRFTIASTILLSLQKYIYHN